MEDKVTIELTKDEALVLFDFLGRFNKADHENVFEDQAEQRVMWNIEAALEKTLVKPFKSNYSEIIKHSRDKIRDKE